MASSSHYSSHPPPRFLSSRRKDNGASFYLLPHRNHLSSYLPHHSCHRCPSLPRRSKSKLILCQATSGTGGFSAPIICPGDHWGMWTTLFATASFGIWSEKTRVGSAISGAMVSILVGMVASSVGLISADSPVYYIVLEFLLPLAVPLLLFNADLRRIVKSTGTVLLAFLIGSAINYVAVSEALGVSPSVLTAGLAADNVVCAIYFASLFALASNIPAELSPSPHENLLQNGHQDRDKLSDDHKQANNLPVLQSAMAVTVSFTICKLGTYITKVFGLQGGKLPCITAIIVVLATMFPTQFGALAPAGEAIALLLMQVFFAAVGANGSVRNVINTTPGILAYSTIQIAVHVAVILGLGRLFGFEKKILLIASNANVGGPTTACGMATTKGWNSLIIPGILAGVMGVAIATFIGIGFGLFVLKHM